MKKTLAQKNHDLTMIWNFGTIERLKLWQKYPTITQWCQLTPEHLMLISNLNRRQIITGMITSNLKQQVIQFGSA